jgi:hypothetical protein
MQEKARLAVLLGICVTSRSLRGSPGSSRPELPFGGLPRGLNVALRTPKLGKPPELCDDDCEPHEVVSCAMLMLFRLKCERTIRSSVFRGLGLDHLSRSASLSVRQLESARTPERGWQKKAALQTLGPARSVGTLRRRKAAYSGRAGSTCLNIERATERYRLSYSYWLQVLIPPSRPGTYEISIRIILLQG